MGLNLPHLMGPASILLVVQIWVGGNELSPRRPDASLALFFCTFFLLRGGGLSFCSHTFEPRMLPDKSFMLMRADWRSGEGRA